MTLIDFKQQTRLSRGKLTNHDQDLEDIYNLGIPGLIYFTMDKKLMGISNIAWMAHQPKVYQVEFLKWMANLQWKATAENINLWISSNDT